MKYTVTIIYDDETREMQIITIPKLSGKCYTSFLEQVVERLKLSGEKPDQSLLFRLVPEVGMG